MIRIIILLFIIIDFAGCSIVQEYPEGKPKKPIYALADAGCKCRKHTDEMPVMKPDTTKQYSGIKVFPDTTKTYSIIVIKPDSTIKYK